MQLPIPKEVCEMLEKLKQNNFLAYIVGGCVRDILMQKEPKDWDIATSAEPEQIQKIFKNSFYENEFFTVSVLTNSKKENLRIVEVTTFRTEGVYRDKRHPSKIEKAKNIEEDLKRRDFTINAIAIDIIKKIIEENGNILCEVKFIDPLGGLSDIENKIIKTVGNPEERFEEDALRLMRAIRFLVTLGEDWLIENRTSEAIIKLSYLIKYVSKERLRDELIRIIMEDKTGLGIEYLRIYGLLQYIIPESLEGYGVSQNKHHIYDVYTHSIKSLQYAISQKFSLEVRLAALLHDIAKPRVKKGEGPDATFYNHDIVSARMAENILRRLKFPKKVIEKVSKLIRYHMFYYNVGEVTPSSIRRLLRAVGKENINELIQLRIADRIGSGCPKAEPYKLRHFKYLVEKVSQDAITTSMLKIDGNDVMKILNISPGPKVGWILNILLAEVIEDPQKNNKEYLTKRVEELGKIEDNTLKEMFEKAKEYLETIEKKRDEMLKSKYWVT